MKDVQAIFIDRDGTIGGTGHFIHPKDFSLYDGVQDAIYELVNAGPLVIAFTNQHRIARGEATEEEFRKQFESYGFDDALICPHSHEEECSCRKPQPGMLLQAAQKYGLDLKKTIVIGDVGSTDMLAAHAVGAKKILVRTGWGEDSLGPFRHKWKDTEPDYIADDLMDAVNWILKDCR